MHVMKKGILYAVLASVLWAIVNPFIKQGLSYDFSPMNFAGLRFTVVGIILFAYTWHRGMWREIMQHRRLFGNLILINMFMGYTAFYFGVDFVSGAIASPPHACFTSASTSCVSASCGARVPSVSSMLAMSWTSAIVEITSTDG